VYKFRSGAKFEGSFEAGVMTKGTYTFPNGDYFFGKFALNVFGDVSEAGLESDVNCVWLCRGVQEQYV
jgi:hypothetical protein